MKLSQKIKHYKRHRQNKKLYDSAEVIYMIALRMELPEDMVSIYVSPIIYEIMRTYHNHIPSIVVHNSLLNKDRFFVSRREYHDMPNVDIPIFNTDIKPVYLGVDIGLRPSVSAPVPNSVTVKEV